MRLVTSPHIILLLLILGTACASTLPVENRVFKIKGVSLEGPSERPDMKVIKEVHALGSNAVCLMPYGFMENASDSITHDSGWQWWGECEVGIRALSEEAHANGMRVMIKPHLWIGHGEYTGELSFEDLEARERWQFSYKDYILSYAEIASDLEVAYFCIGTELCSQVAEDPLYWEELIQEVRSIYKGQVTYAANWDCYTRFPHWDKLDHIGIDAYFPLESPSTRLEDIKAAWAPWKSAMRAMSDSLDKAVLFTEYGYRSVKGMLETPWVVGHEGTPDQEVQANAYQALYEEVWSEDWSSGGFLWKWHCPERLYPEGRQHDFTPQGKLALDVIKAQFGAQSLEKVDE